MRYLITLALAAAPLTGALAQQQKGTELALGITGIGVTISGGSTVFQFQVNQRLVSAAIYASPTIAIEPSAGITVASGSGSSVAIVQLGLDVPIYTRRTWGHSGLYFSPGAAVTILSADASGTGASANQFSIGLGIGDKIRLAEPVSLNFSGNFAYSFSNSTFRDAVNLNAQLGLSVFLH